METAAKTVKAKRTNFENLCTYHGDILSPFGSHSLDEGYRLRNLVKLEGVESDKKNQHASDNQSELQLLSVSHNVLVFVSEHFCVLIRSVINVDEADYLQY